MNLKIECHILFLLFFSLNTSSVFAREKISWLNEIKNLRWAVDVSARGSYSAGNNHLSHQESLGLDLHKVFTSAEGGDIGTLIFQGYLTKLNNVEPYPPFFKNETDLKFICRICNFNLTILDNSCKFNGI